MYRQPLPLGFMLFMTSNVKLYPEIDKLYTPTVVGYIECTLISPAHSLFLNAQAIPCSVPSQSDILNATITGS